MTSTIIPLVYGLLIGKNANDYSVFFRKVLEQDNFSPETILTDFETGTIKSIKETLPHVIHKGRKKRNIIKDTNYPSLSLLGCLFHFGQSVWRHVQNKGLSNKYQEDETFRLNVKKLIALAFLPLSDVVAGFDLVAAVFDDDADDFIDYFEKTWIGEPTRRGKTFNLTNLH